MLIILIIVILLLFYISILIDKKASKNKHKMKEKILNNILCDSKNLKRIKSIASKSNDESQIIRKIRETFGVNLMMGVKIYNQVIKSKSF